MIAQNRAKEIEKMQAKLAQKEKRIKMVQERKKAMGNSSNEDLMRLSWGGELDGGAAAAAASNTDYNYEDEMGESTAMTGGRGSASTVNSRKGMKRGPGQVFSTKHMNDADSGKGSSATSSTNNSRSGSGRVLEESNNHSSDRTMYRPIIC
jgi:hypothetical protein